MFKSTWSTVSDGVKRISGPQKFDPDGGEDFFNRIGHDQTFSWHRFAEPKFKVKPSSQLGIQRAGFEQRIGTAPAMPNATMPVRSSRNRHE